MPDQLLAMFFQMSVEVGAKGQSLRCLAVKTPSPGNAHRQTQFNKNVGGVTRPRGTKASGIKEAEAATTVTAKRARCQQTNVDAAD